MEDLGAKEATGSGFRARTGTLTLLFIAGSADREDLLEMLEGALEGGRLVASDDDELDEGDLYLDDERGDDASETPAEPEPPIGPDTRLRASSKGEQFLYVAFILERWLRNSPDGPLELGPTGAEAIASLVCCWSATVTHALASEPMTLEELDRAVHILSYDTVEEHVEVMERVGQVEALPGDGETRYALTTWMREGFAAIAAAARMELHYPEPDVAPPDMLDVDAAFELTLPLVELPAGLRGSPRLAVRVPGTPPSLVGATAEVETGQIVASSPLLDEEPDTWISGTAREWLDTLVDPTSLQLEVGGDLTLVEGMLIGLHKALFGIPTQ